MKRNNSIILYAPNIHQGGGKSLLLALLEECGDDILLCIDKRLELPMNFEFEPQIRRISPTLLGRFMAEIWLMRFAIKKDIVICLGNLPPIFRLPCFTFVFLQNRHLVDRFRMKTDSPIAYLRMVIQRFLFTINLSHVDQFIVQTPSMKRLLTSKFKDAIPIEILPFIGGYTLYSREPRHCEILDTHKYDFVYVASGEPHKNHEALISAWGLLADENIFPTLCLTLDKSVALKLFSNFQFIKKLKIYNVGVLSHESVLLLYKNSGAMIFPSKLESLGLPLIEARRIGLPILASELDYVRDVLDPEEVFDPDSPVSIARAVKRFMKIKLLPLPIVGAKKFFAFISARRMF